MPDMKLWSVSRYIGEQHYLMIIMEVILEH